MVKTSYIPPASLLNKYADVIVNFALGNGQGVGKDEVIYLSAPVFALPLARAVYQKALEKSCNVMTDIQDDAISKIFVEKSTEKNLLWFPKPYYKSLSETIDYWVRIEGSEDPLYLSNIPPIRSVAAKKRLRPFRKMLEAKEKRNDFSWTIVLYGTQKMAEQAGLSLSEYWRQISEACYLNHPDPIETWKKTYSEMNRIISRLNKMPIKKIRLVSTHTDITFSIGSKRRWIGGRGRNIPSFEIFTSPDWRGTNGHIYFNYPLYYNGSLIKNIFLTFKKGKLTEIRADEGEALLKEIASQKGGDAIGEFSLTDKRFSGIYHFMGHTLFDENYGGKWGNTHIALGNSYAVTYAGKGLFNSAVKKKYGFNESVIHTDIIATEKRTVSALFNNGDVTEIYKNGSFLI